MKVSIQTDRYSFYVYVEKTNESRLMKIRACEQKVFCVYATLKNRLSYKTATAAEVSFIPVSSIDCF